MFHDVTLSNGRVLQIEEGQRTLRFITNSDNKEDPKGQLIFGRVSYYDDGEPKKFEMGLVSNGLHHLESLLSDLKTDYVESRPYVEIIVEGAQARVAMKSSNVDVKIINRDEEEEGDDEWEDEWEDEDDDDDDMEDEEDEEEPGEEAKQDEPVKPAFQVGQLWRTRGDKEMDVEYKWHLRITKIDSDYNYSGYPQPIEAVVEKGNNCSGSVEHFTINGKYFTDDGYDSVNDLVELIEDDPKDDTEPAFTITGLGYYKSQDGKWCHVNVKLLDEGNEKWLGTYLRDDGSPYDYDEHAYRVENYEDFVGKTSYLHAETFNDNGYWFGGLPSTDGKDLVSGPHDEKELPWYKEPVKEPEPNQLLP